MNVFNVKTSYIIFQRYMKKGATCWTLGQKVKGQPSHDFLGALICWQDILTHLGQCVFIICTQIKNNERKMQRKFLWQIDIDQGQ